MTPDAPALVCEKLTKRYGRTPALRAVDLVVDRGECVALFGRNGAGKTTLLHIAGSLLRGYEGDVRIFGESLRRPSPETRRATGLVLHDTCLYLDLSARDNLRFFAKLYRVDNPDGCAQQLLERIELVDRADTPARDLSRGMKQRLSLARAFVHNPRLLLLDEPFTGLDEVSSQALSTLLKEFTAEGGTVLMSTHDLERAFHAATRAVILERGAITYDRPAGETDIATFRHAYWHVLFTGSARA